MLTDIQVTPAGNWLLLVWVIAVFQDGRMMRQIHRDSARVSRRDAAEAIFS